MLSTEDRKRVKERLAKNDIFSRRRLGIGKAKILSYSITATR